MGTAGAQGEEWFSEVFEAKMPSLEFIISQNDTLNGGARFSVFLENYLHFPIITSHLSTNAFDLTYLQ